MFFTAQMMPLFIRSDVVNKLQACFPQNKLSSALYNYTLISMRCRLRDKSQGTVCKVRNAKNVTNKILNTFTVTHCSVTKFSSHVTALLLVILQHSFWKQFLWHIFYEPLLWKIVINFTVIGHNILLSHQIHFTHHWSYAGYTTTEIIISVKVFSHS